MQTDTADHPSPSPRIQSNIRLPKRRRVALACTSCRQRKSRCDGIRPMCSACKEFSTSCRYEGLQSHGTNMRKQNDQPTYAQLTKKIEELEARLRLKTPEPAVQPSSPATNLGLMDDETPIDSLATNAFDEVPQRDIGYFGPTSNHALFRKLSSAFAYQLPLMIQSQEQFPESFTREYTTNVPLFSQDAIPSPFFSQNNVHSNSVDPYYLPNDRDILGLMNHFFATIGIVLPYVDKTFVLHDSLSLERRPIWHTSKPGRALLNIICAHASFTLCHGAAEDFYRRALSLLDELTLRRSSLELVQALLLLCSFQQNTQRSIASWTYHAVAVKAALQLGLHSPASYEEHGLQKRELLKRVWFGVINQDSYLSVSLGRPCLIVADHVRIESPLAHPHNTESMLACNRNQNDGLVYYNLLISLHKIRTAVIDVLYDHNVDSPRNMPMQDAAIKRLQFVCELERWRQSCSSVTPVLSSADLDSWSASSYDENRFSVLLSIQYYSTALLINSPVLIGLITDNSLDKDLLLPLVDNHILTMKHNFIAATELERIVRHLVESAPRFMDHNATWWFCNYNMFTVNLHLFGILLACCRDHSMSLQKVVDSSAVRESLNAGLQTLEAIERSSLMSRKGRHCLRKFLEVFDKIGPYQPPTIPRPVDKATTGTILETPLDDYYAQLVTESADDFMFQSSQLGFLDSDMSGVNLNLGIENLLQDYTSSPSPEAYNRR